MLIARTNGLPRSIWTRSFVMANLVLAATLAGCGGPGASGGPDASGGPGGSSVIPAGHPLIGTWTVDVSRADFAAAGVTDPGPQNENSGRFLWTFAPDGTWTQVQQSLDGAPVNNPIFRGTYTFEGDTLVATTTFPTQYADDGLHYTWVITGDEVQFDLLDPPDPILPIMIETHPWKRTG